MPGAGMAPKVVLRGLSRRFANGTYALVLALLVAGCSGGGDASVAATDGGATPPISAGQLSIVARTGPIVTVRVGETAMLDGTKSTTSSSGPLTYSWTFSSKPADSIVELQDPAAANPSFVTDARGTFVAQLVVSSEGVSSQRAVQIVVATVSPEPGNFHEGLSSSCENCHNDGFPGIPGKTLEHIATSNTCATCHTTLGLNIVPFVDHREVFGNCSGCHDGVSAIGKSEFHEPTSAECDDCHNTVRFLELEPDGSYDHTGISRSCLGCHNGTISIGMTPSPPHPVTATECGFCHTTESFLGAYPDHTGPEVVGIPLRYEDRKSVVP